jgi:hypothetical protein
VGSRRERDCTRDGDGIERSHAPPADLEIGLDPLNHVALELRKRRCARRRFSLPELACSLVGVKGSFARLQRRRSSSPPWRRIRRWVNLKNLDTSSRKVSPRTRFLSTRLFFGKEQSEEAERSIRASIGWNPWRHCAAWRKGSERQFGCGLPLRDCHRNCPLWPTTTALWRPIFDCWFSKSGQQGAPKLREAASHVIGGDKMIGFQPCTQVAIAK